MINLSFEILDWMVIGSGPAGIAAVGKLIDQGVHPAKIGWMDPHFTVGDLGRKWANVPSNTTVELFLRFLNGSDAFGFKKRTTKFPIEKLKIQDTCLLQNIVEPLQWVTDNLKKKVHPILDHAVSLTLADNKWEIKGEKSNYHGKNVILAIGADPKILSRPVGPEIISLESALDKEKLAKLIQPNDTVGVFGSSHSAILALANLQQLSIKQIVHFYRSFQRYAIPMEGWILFDNTGLKGFTANWAKKYLDGKLPKNFKRVLLSDHAFEEEFSLCNKIIYAVGFEKRRLPLLEQYQSLHYDDKTGIIGPGLFGLGIAFPQAKFDPLGHLELRVGLWKFMDYLNAILPIWTQYSHS